MENEEFRIVLKRHLGPCLQLDPCLKHAGTGGDLGFGFGQAGQVGELEGRSEKGKGREKSKTD